MKYRDRLVLVWDRDKARAALERKGMSIYQLSMRAGSNRRYQKYFMPGSPDYVNINTNTLSEIAFAAGLSPLDFVTLLGPKEQGGEKPLPPQFHEMPEKRYLRGFNSERGEWVTPRLRGRPFKETSIGGQGDCTPRVLPDPTGILTPIKGDSVVEDNEIVDPFA